MPSRAPSAVAALVLAALAAFVVAPREALATRDYAKKEAKDCAFCHVSEKGSGPRNAKGREYEANGHQFGVKSWSSEPNEKKYLRASCAVVAQWYSEAGRLLDELRKEETLPGGLALTDALREKFRMFKRAWLGGAKKCFRQPGDLGLAAGAAFLAKVESQFAGTDEAREAAKLLDDMAKDGKTKDLAEAARAAEKTRLLLLEGRTEFQLGRDDEARALFDKALADPRSKDFEKELREALDALPEAARK
jgi:hypothetical protein